MGPKITLPLNEKYILLGILLSLVLAACTPRGATLPEASPTFRFGVPVESESNALIAARSALQASFTYTEPLSAVNVEQMSYTEYCKFIGASINRPGDPQVWLVIFYDPQWQVISPPGTPPPPFQGCVSVAVDAADGTPLEVGGPLHPGILAQCDQ